MFLQVVVRNPVVSSHVVAHRERRLIHHVYAVLVVQVVAKSLS